MFDSTKPAGTPKARFAYLFPSPNAALVSVRMKAGLSERERTRTIGLIRKAVAMPQWRLQHGGTYLVTGEPVIVSDLNNSITHSIELLLVAVLLVMAATLGLIFSGRPRLLPLGIALLAAALTFGALSLVGRFADDGLDRGAAGARGAGGGLRDPVPVAGRRRPAPASAAGPGGRR